MSEKGETTLSQTVIAGSEEDFDVICDPCLNEGQRVQATGHCIDCRENLCPSCFRLHKKLSALKDHVIHGNSTLTHSQKSKSTVNKPENEKDPLTDRCPKHPEELIKFYCNSHHTLGCSVCVPLNHRSCNDIQYIREVSDGVADSGELEKIRFDLQALVSRLTSTRSRVTWVKQVANDSCAKAVSDIRDMKKKINELLDQFENEILEEASNMREKKGKSMDTMVSTCESMIGETKEILADIEKKKSLKQNNRLFISMKMAQDRLNTLADEAISVSEEDICERLSFTPVEQLTELLSTLTSLGTVSLVRQPADIKAENQEDIYVKIDTDTNKCLISGMIVLLQDRLGLTDQNNMSVKIADVARGKVTQHIKLESKPIDLTRLEGDEIAVTVNGKRYIQVLSVSPTLAKCHNIKVADLYLGIQYVSAKLFLICVDPIKGVHILDMSGFLLQQIVTDYSGNQLFTLPSRIAISPDHGVLYISDCNGNAMVSVTTDGSLISKHNDRLEGPRGIVVNDDGYVYLCSSDHTVHMLSPSAKLIKISSVTEYPAAIGHGAGKLYISSKSQVPAYCNTIKVYRLKTK